MTNLVKHISRVTSTYIYESGKAREVVVHLEPRRIGFRAKGCKKIYWLTADGLYRLAVQAHIRDEKRQKAKGKRGRK